MARLDKYIEIKQIPYEGKTKRWGIFNKITKEVIGDIRWYGGWRKYVFQITDSRAQFMDADFMRMLADFCDDRTKEQLS